MPVINPKDLDTIIKGLEKQLQVSLVAVSRRTDLAQSRLIKSIEGIITADGGAILANEYIDYVDRGRSAGAKRVPLDKLIDWINHYGLGGGLDSRGKQKLAFNIQRSIYINGIQARPFLDDYRKEAELYVNDVLTRLVFDYITANTINVS